jgi:hypothetical protein
LAVVEMVELITKVVVTVDKHHLDHIITQLVAVVQIRTGHILVGVVDTAVVVT